jgi:hypothetical protein
VPKTSYWQPAALKDGERYGVTRDAWREQRRTRQQSRRQIPQARRVTAVRNLHETDANSIHGKQILPNGSGLAILRDFKESPAIETAVGTALFRRLGGRVVLTEAGQRLYAYAQRILDLHREARRRQGQVFTEQWD